ncbi:hypothetical protein BGZ49_003513 [Haplosporangium sp. Z 27]|nr:hypothetical protein BGZ49_003513 [Haplosporangium sp. Z 27]
MPPKVEEKKSTSRITERIDRSETDPSAKEKITSPRDPREDHFDYIDAMSKAAPVSDDHLVTKSTKSRTLSKKRSSSASSVQAATGKTKHSSDHHSSD